MGDLAPSPGRFRSAREIWPAVAGLVAVLAAAVWIRWPAFFDSGLVSHDVGGILHNAMVLHRGGLPYVDTVEMKAPGTFYLALLLAGDAGRDIAAFQLAANLCALLGVGALAALTWRVWGRLSAVAAAALYVLHDAFLDSMDANYVTWTGLPQILAIWSGYEATRRRSRRAEIALWGLAGVLAGVSVLLKRPAGAVLPVLLLWALFARPNTEADRGAHGSGGPGRSLKGVMPGRGRLFPVFGILAGFVAAHVPIAAHYWSRGVLGALIDGYLLNRWGGRYLQARGAPLWAEGFEGALALAFFLALPLALASFALIVPKTGSQPRGRPGPEAARLWLWGWFVATLVAAALGFRFYKGYFLPVAAPLCILAAAPWGLLGRGCRLPVWPRAALTLPLLFLLVRQGWMLEETRRQRPYSRDSGARKIASHLVKNTDDGDTIWVWGWHLWGVYALSDRVSASPIYKAWGLLTPPNDNTWRRPGSKLRFVEGPPSRQLVMDFERNPPAYIVFGSAVPHRSYPGLQTLLRDRYVRDRRVRLGRVQFWRYDPEVAVEHEVPRPRR